ncbi:acyltransferase family protein [Spongiibacter nanhainus]|uniref:Acyltransferase family protein n=1 Tax=Spongiibacter nanhainus TaxID=2794344 RepID=A0A7T4URP2_9GAMM|nr:lysophospholipid acyltransferase family protein [Spongiibacter nanhainus]QQD18575.1 acyltransferase family protein [Spongiibacter nanhainus]
MATIGTTPAKNELDLMDMVEQSLSSESRAIRHHKSFSKLAKLLFSPRLSGVSNLSPSPVLMVGNHSLFSLDVPLIQSSMLTETGRFVRAMADKVLFKNPSTKSLILNMGGVLGSPVVGSSLMEKGKDLMVFPGGSYEVNKPIHERYTLKWKDRVGFVRLAAKHGYTILPFATVGPDEFYDRYCEGIEWFDSPFGKLLRKTGLLSDNIRQDLLVPIPKGVLGTFIPKPQKFYMGICEPLNLSEYKSQDLDDGTLVEIRDVVAHRIEAKIHELLLMRVQESSRGNWLRRQLVR